MPIWIERNRGPEFPRNKISGPIFPEKNNFISSKFQENIKKDLIGPERSMLDEEFK